MQQKKLENVFAAEKSHAWIHCRKKNLRFYRLQKTISPYTLQKIIVYILYAAENNSACVNVNPALYTCAIIFCSIYGHNYFLQQMQTQVFFLQCIHAQLFSAAYTDAYFFSVAYTGQVLPVYAALMFMLVTLQEKKCIYTCYRKYSRHTISNICLNYGT